MNLRYLRIFRTVCRENSITRAAEKLYISQPAVSHAIKELEDETGLILFDRLKKRLYLTEAGRLFLEKTIPMLELYDELEKGAAALDKQAPLRIGSSITIGNFLLPGILTVFREKHPDTPLRITVDNAGAVEAGLLDNQFDLALIERGSDKEELLQTPFSSFALVLFCSPSHPFALRKKTALKELIGEPLLLREKGSAIRNAIDSFFFLNHESPSAMMTSANSQVLIQAVRHNLGVGILPRVLIQEELNKGTLCEFNVSGCRLTNQNYIVTHRDKLLTASAKEFKSLVEKYTKDSGKSF